MMPIRQARLHSLMLAGFHSGSAAVALMAVTQKSTPAVIAKKHSFIDVCITRSPFAPIDYMSGRGQQLQEQIIGIAQQRKVAAVAEVDRFTALRDHGGSRGLEGFRRRVHIADAELQDSG